jgi:hypothetical protein
MKITPAHHAGRSVVNPPSTSHLTMVKSDVRPDMEGGKKRKNQDIAKTLHAGRNAHWEFAKGHMLCRFINFTKRCVHSLRSAG